MHTFTVSAEYQDRKFGPSGKSFRVEATSLAGAIGKAGREFLNGLTRSQKFDAGKSGVKLTVLRVAE